MKNNYFFIYETTNLINNKKYRGIHKTTNINDGYIGSGTSFKNSVKKYGKENFRREILEYCNSYEELLEIEKIYVDYIWIGDKSNYNIKTGGQSAGILSDESKRKISDTLKEKYKSGEIFSNIGERRKGKSPINKGICMSDEQKEKCSKSGKERFKNDDNHPLKLFGSTTVTEETKDKISKTLKEMYKNGQRIAITTPISEEHKMKISESLKEKYKNIEHHSKGKPSWNKGIETKKDECPHCKKMVDKGNGKRWHFDNCKNKK